MEKCQVETNDGEERYTHRFSRRRKLTMLENEFGIVTVTVSFEVHSA
jgi:hypothetical protein